MCIDCSCGHGFHYPPHARSSCWWLLPTLCPRPLHTCFSLWFMDTCMHTCTHRKYMHTHTDTHAHAKQSYTDTHPHTHLPPPVSCLSVDTKLPLDLSPITFLFPCSSVLFIPVLPTSNQELSPSASPCLPTPWSHCHSAGTDHH